MPIILLLIGFIGLAIVFPPMWFVYMLFAGVALLDKNN